MPTYNAALAQRARELAPPTNGVSEILQLFNPLHVKAERLVKGRARDTVSMETHTA